MLLSVSQFASFYCRVVFHCVNKPQFLCPFSYWWTLGFQWLAVVSKATMHITFCFYFILVLFGSIPEPWHAEQALSLPLTYTPSPHYYAHSPIILCEHNFYFLGKHLWNRIAESEGELYLPILEGVSFSKTLHCLQQRMEFSLSLYSCQPLISLFNYRHFRSV